MKVLLTGGAGYIGSHTAVECLAAGHEVVVFDNLSNSSVISLDRVVQIAGKPVSFVEGDIRDRAALRKLFAERPIDAVVHFAGLKAVGESVGKPLLYYDNNIGGSVTLFEAMQAAGVKTVVFSSSATVYGDPATVPIREDFPVGATTNPTIVVAVLKKEMHLWKDRLLQIIRPSRPFVAVAKPPAQLVERAEQFQAFSRLADPDP